MTCNPHTRAVGRKTDPAKVWVKGSATQAAIGAPTLVRCWGPRGGPGSHASALYRGAPKSQPGRGAAENLQGNALYTAFPRPRHPGASGCSDPVPLPFVGRRSGRWGAATDWHTITPGASQRQGWGPGRVSTAFLPSRRGSSRGWQGKLVGLRPRGPPKGSAQSPKGARAQTHTRERRRGRGLTLLPGQRPARTESTAPFPRRARARGPERGAPSRAHAAPAPAAGGARGGLPARGLGRRGSRRVHGVCGEAGRGRRSGRRVRRSQPPPRPSFAVSALTHRPPSRAGGGQRPGRSGGGAGAARAGGGAGPRGGAGAGRGRREQGAPRPREHRPRAARLRGGRLCPRRAPGAGAAPEEAPGSPPPAPPGLCAREGGPRSPGAGGSRERAARRRGGAAAGEAPGGLSGRTRARWADRRGDGGRSTRRERCQPRRPGTQNRLPGGGSGAVGLYVRS